MSTIAIHHIVQDLERGVLDLSHDLETFEELTLAELLPELSHRYPIRFLERYRGQTHEVGIAQTRRRNRYRRCLLVTQEADGLTTLAFVTFLRFRHPRAPDEPYDLTVGGGFSLYRTPDGWNIKLLQERTVSLTRHQLQERGWIVE